MDDLIERLEKSAGFGMIGLRKGIGTFVKNFSHMGINSAQKALDHPALPNGSFPSRSEYPAFKQNLEKNLHNAKVDHNLTVAGTAAGAVAAGAGLGGYAAYQKSQNPEVNDLMSQNQVSQNDQFNKAAEELTEIFHGDLVNRLEKSAAIAFVPIHIPDPGDQGDVAAAQQAEVAPLPQPVDPSQPQGAEGIDPAQLGITQADEQQEGPVNASQAVATAPAQNGSALDQGPVMGGPEPISPESQELQAILAAQQQERQQESIPSPQAQGQGAVPAQEAPPQETPAQQAPAQEAPAQQVPPQEAPAQETPAQESPEQGEEGEEDEEKKKRQGAGSVSNAPAGEDKTAAELLNRLDKTAAESYSVDKSTSGGTPGDKSSQVKNFWHKLSPAEIQEEDQTEPNDKQKALYERLTLTSGGYDAASQAANLTKKAGDDAIDPDHDGDDDRPGSKNNPDKAEDEKNGIVAKAKKEEKEDGKKSNPFAKKDDDKKEDDKKEEKKNPFEKSAFAIPGAGAVGGALKNFAGHLTGSTFRGANQALNAWNTPEALVANAPKVGVSNFRNHLEGLEAAKNTAQASMHKTQALTGVGAGAGLAGIGAGHAIHNQQQNEQMQQTASEEDDVMNGLFKEAAAMIINEEIPEVKQHIDIMDRIKF